MNFQEILDRFEARRSGASWMAKCPAHQDSTASLSISEENGKILLHCHAGCSTKDVLGAMSLSFEDLHEGPKLVATYDYVDETGKLLSQVCRFEPKNFKQRKPDGAGGWSWNLNGVRRVPYNLRAVLKSENVLIVEGEKDVHRAFDLELVATCNPGGAGKWRDEYSDFLRGKNVTIVPDNDEPGRSHTEQVAQSLAGKAASIAICYLPESIKDLSDYPMSRESLIELISRAPAWTREAGDASLFQNFNDYENAPSMRFAIENFLQENAVTAIAGLSGHAKTWIALSIARALLFGPGTLWDLFKVPERAERLIYLIPESSIGPFKHRLQVMELYDEIRSGRLLTRTLSKGPSPSLQDPRLLRAAKGADVILDTGIRFMLSMESENSASEAAKGLSEDFFALQRAEARTILVLFHSPKSFGGQSAMTLENMIRGSGELGAALATAWGIKQIEKSTNTVHMENIKARDFEACGPFEIVGRPHIDQTGNFQLHKAPDVCGSLADEQPELHSNHNSQKHDQRIQRVATVAAWLAEDPNMSSREMLDRFKARGVNDVNEGTIKKYRMAARKGLL